MCVVWVRAGLPGRRRSVCSPPAPAECHWQLARTSSAPRAADATCGVGVGRCRSLPAHRCRSIAVGRKSRRESAGDRGDRVRPSETGLGSRRRAACVRRAQPGTCQPGRTPWRTRAPLHRRTAQLTIPRVASCRVQQQHETEQRGLAPNRPPLPARQTALFSGASSLDLIGPSAWPAAPGALVGPAAPLHTVT